MADQKNIARADFIKALSHPTRLKIIEYLQGGEKCVCEIHISLDLEQANVSRHLSILKKEGLLQSRKEGLKVIYWVTDQSIYKIIGLCDELIRQMWLEKAIFVK